MKVYALNSFNSRPNNNYAPNFNGYNEVLREGARTTVKSLKEAETLFGDLLTEINQDVMITKYPFFDAIKNIFDGRGLKGLFGILGNSSDSNIMVEKLIQTARKEEVVSVAKQRSSIFDLICYGKKPKDFHLGFCSGTKKSYIEFYSDKKGDIFVERTYGKDYVNTGFYSDTGTKKVEIVSYGDTAPDKTFYNKDGTKPFFKNWFLGGPAIEPIY